MRELIDQGGWVLGGIVLLSLAAWTLVVGTWLRLRRDTERGLAWADAVVSCVLLQMPTNVLYSILGVLT